MVVVAAALVSAPMVTSMSSSCHFTGLVSDQNDVTRGGSVLKRQVLWVLASAGAIVVGSGASAAIHAGYHLREASTVLAASLLSPSTAAADAVHAVGGGYATHTSLDHYQGAQVFDVHVLYQKTLWDVKVSMAGTILQKKLASEQPGSQSSGTSSENSTSSSQNSESPVSSVVTSAEAGAVAVHAVGGGVVHHISADRLHGVPVWDVHVLDNHQIWDVKVSQSTGAVMEKKLSSEQTASSEGQGQSSDHTDQSATGSADQPISGGPAGVLYGAKLTAPPSAYASYVTQAMTAVHGLSLKWVKFTQESHGDYQMAVKIRLVTGTVKVKDTFNSQAQLIAQKIASDN